LSLDARCTVDGRPVLPKEVSMQRFLLVGPLAGVILVTAVGAEAPPQTQAPVAPAGEPKITLSQEAWDFGSVRHLEKPELTISISNTGTAELEILKVGTSCGCTAAEPEKLNLLPGEATPLKITYNTRGKRGRTGADVTIESNDKITPKKVFHITGEVKRAVRIEPEYAVFRLLSPDEMMSLPVHIVNTSPQPMHLKLGPYASHKFTAELKETRPGQEYEIVITTKPPIPQRTMADTLEVTTGLEDEPRLEISTQVIHIDRVNFLQPALLVYGDPQQTHQSPFQIEYFGTDPAFRVTKAECDEPHVSVRIDDPLPPEADRPGRKPTSIVTVVPEFPPQTVFPPAGLPIRLLTNDPDYPVLTIYATRDMAQYRDLTIRSRGRSQRKTP
jgi:hypothetical protein